MKKQAPPPPAILAIESRGFGFVGAMLWAAWAGAALWAYFSSGHTPFFSLKLWIDVLPPVWDMPAGVAFGHGLRLLKLAAFAAACAGVGRALLRRVFRVTTLNLLESFSFSYGLGTGAAGMLLLFLGLTGLLRPLFVGAASLVFAVAAAVFNRDLFTDRPTPDPRPPTPYYAWPFAALSVLALAVSGFYALAPEVFYDSLVYHLATPSLWTLSGGLVPTPTNLYTGFPMHGEMLYAWALLADGDVLAKLIHWSTGPAIAAALLGLAARARRPAAGWAACALFLTTPLVGLSLYKTAVEGLSTWMLLLSAHSLLLWLMAPAEDPERPGLWTLSALTLGLAMATKYTNWPALGVLGLCLLVLRLPLVPVARYAAVALACIGPWVVKNLWFYGNPVFPYLHERLQPAAWPVNWRALQSDAWGRDWNSLLAGGARPVFEVLAHPWFMSVRGASDADFLGPLFLVGLPALAFWRPAGREGRVLLGVLAGLWMLWWPMTAMPRFFMPGLALLSLWLAFSFDALPSGFPRGAVAGVAALLMLNNVFWVALSSYHLDTWPVTVSGAPAGAYLGHPHATYPTPYYAAADWLNGNAPASAKVLIVGDGRGFYLERPFLAASALDADILPAWLKAAPNAGALKARLDREGVGYLLANIGELVRLRRDSGLGAREVGVLDAFLKSFARKRFEDVNQDPRDFRWTVVYEISDHPEGPPDQGSPLLGWYRRILEERGNRR